MTSIYSQQLELNFAFFMPKNNKVEFVENIAKLLYKKYNGSQMRVHIF